MKQMIRFKVSNLVPNSTLSPVLQTAPFFAVYKSILNLKEAVFCLFQLTSDTICENIKGHEQEVSKWIHERHHKELRITCKVHVADPHYRQ